MDQLCKGWRWTGGYHVHPLLHKALESLKKYPYLERIANRGLNTELTKDLTKMMDISLSTANKNFIHVNVYLHGCGLNNAKCGTKFYHQNRTIRARQGRLLMADLLTPLDSHAQRCCSKYR